MSKAKYLQFIASFLILLIINLAIYVPVSYAKINSVSVKGNDGAEGFVRADDALTFTASVSLPISNNQTTNQSTQTIQITKDQVVLAPNNVFDTCSAANGTTICTLKYPASGTATFQSKILPYAIKFYKDAARTKLDDYKSGNFIVDSKPPQLKLSVSKGIYSGQENVVLNYEITDSACDDPACAKKCSGIKSLELRSSDNSFKQSVAIDKKDCAYKSSLNIESKKFKSGKITLIGTAIDAVNQASPESAVAFVVDSTPPGIIVSSFTIKRKGIPINTYSQFAVAVEVSIDISGNDLDTSSVTGDFTPLNPSVTEASAACSATKTNIFTCKWLFELIPQIPPTQNSVTGNAVSDITTNAVGNTTTSTGTTTSTTASTTSTSTGTTTSTSTIPAGTSSANTSKTSAGTNASDASSTTTQTKNPNAITITALDLVGNKATATITKTLTLDDKGPVVQSLVTPYFKDDKYYARASGNVIIATFTDASGVSEDGAILHADGSTIPATACTKVANSVCTWRNVNFNSDQATISIEQDTTDIMLNPVTEPKKTEIIVDSKPPVVNKINVTPVGTLSDLIIDLFKIGDKLSIVANVTEENDLTAYGDFSKFIKKATRVPGTCTKANENTYACTWLTDAVSIQGSGQLKFVFNDTAGNEASAVKDLTVLGLETSAPPNFWDSKASCSPKSVDRQLGTLFNQRTYCRIKLERKAENIETLSISPVTLSSCKSTQPVVQSIESFNTQRGSTEPFLAITLKKDPLNINEAKLTCTFSIISRSGNRVTKNPETETAEIEIKFYNFPLGKFDQGIQDKIDNAKKEARESLKVVGQLNKIMFYARKICQMFGIIYTMAVIYTTVTVAQKVIAEAMKSNPITAGPSVVVDEAATGSCYGQQSAEEQAGKHWQVTGGKFCKFVNCQWAPGIIGDYQEWISNQINKLPGGKRVPGGGRGSDIKLPQIGVTESDVKKADAEDTKQTDSKSNEKKSDSRVTRTGLAGYYDPQNNLITGILFACVPGIISGLDKYRQIKCLYADCLENAVAKDGMSPTVCEELKNFAECKYIYGEIFAVFPYTALIDHFTSVIKDALSNPFAALSIGLSLTVGSACRHTCPAKGPGSSSFYITCQVIKITSKFGEVIENIQGMYKEGFKIRQDYCSRLDLGEEQSQSTQTQQSGQSSSSSQSSQQSTQSSNQPSTGNR